MNAEQIKRLNQQRDVNLRDIEKAEAALMLAQGKVTQAYIALGRTNALIDLTKSGRI